tara:strand:- start:34 stop:1554 length:1521 start_codon:yes stop_codon:yes gene_type:complete
VIHSFIYSFKIKVDNPKNINESFTFKELYEKYDLVVGTYKLDYNIPFFIRNKDSLKYKTSLCLFKYNFSKITLFDIESYKILNFDLRSMTNNDIVKHFLNHGWKNQKRLYYIPESESIINKQYISSQQINCNRLLILNHSDGLTGAPWVAYNMFIEMKKSEIIETYLFTPNINQNMINKLSIKSNEYILEYYHNPSVIKYWIKILKPSVILINSFSSEFLEIQSLLEKEHENSTKIIYYTHEDPTNYIPNQVNIRLKFSELWCADHKTYNYYSKIYNNVSVYPPKFRKDYFKNIFLKNNIINQSYIPIWKKIKFKFKPVVGMVGEQSSRKNFEGFLEIAKKLKSVEFIWIGGNKKKININNVTIIEQTPYCIDIMKKYLDCFLLVSKLDHCPIVILEALSINIKCIYFSDNVGYNYLPCENIVKLDGNVENIDLNLLRSKIIKNKKYNKIGYNYIKEYFVYKKNELLYKFFDNILEYKNNKSNEFLNIIENIIENYKYKNNNFLNE